MALNLEQLRNIDVQDLSSWPTAFKIFMAVLVGLMIAGGGYWFFIKDLQDQLEVVRAREQTLRTTYLEKKALAINLPAYQTQMREMEETFGVMLRQLPDKTEIPELLIDITQAGLGRGLQFELFKPGLKTSQDFYATLPISIQVVGTYHQIGEFVSDLAGLPRIVSLGDIQISEAGKNSGRLRMSATALTYHYLDEAEASAANKAKQGGKRK